MIDPEAFRQFEQRIEERFDRLEARLDAAEGKLSFFEMWRQRGIGAVMLLGLGFSAAGATVATLWHQVTGR